VRVLLYKFVIGRAVREASLFCFLPDIKKRLKQDAINLGSIS